MHNTTLNILFYFRYDWARNYTISSIPIVSLSSLKQNTDDHGIEYIPWVLEQTEERKEESVVEMMQEKKDKWQVKAILHAIMSRNPLIAYN